MAGTSLNKLNDQIKNSAGSMLDAINMMKNSGTNLASSKQIESAAVISAGFQQGGQLKVQDNTRFLVLLTRFIPIFFWTIASLEGIAIFMMIMSIFCVTMVLLTQE